MAFFKTDLPKLLTKKELQAKASMQSASTEHQDQPNLEKSVAKASIPDGILITLKAKEEAGLLALPAFELIQLLLQLIEQVQSPTKDGKSGLALKIHPHFQERDGKMAFLLFGEEEVLGRAIQLIQKINRHLQLLQKGGASHQQIPPSWAKAYRQLFKRLKQYQQIIECIDTAKDKNLLALSEAASDDLIAALDQLKAKPKKVSMQGKITGLSQHKNLIEFQVDSKEWNGIRTQKAVGRPMSCKANKAMLEFAKKHLDQEIEFEALLEFDENGNKKHQLLAILVKTEQGILKERIVYEGPRAGQYYLSYMGKRIYLPKAKRSVV
jgi:hypothetical protein